MLLRAFAKINLDLRVLERRPDGYHEIRTILQTIDWFDEIRIDDAASFAFSASGTPGDHTNLVVRAVREFECVSGMPVNARVHLTKNIPAGAGLGGGSADAAVTMIALQRFCGHEFSPADLWRSLRSLGSDVPFFAVGGSAVGVGRGDEVIPLEDMAPSWLVLADSGAAVPTAEAYSWLTLQARRSSIEGFCARFVARSEAGQRAGMGGLAGAPARNDFEAPVFQRFPELSGIKQELLRSGAYHAALTGSGAVLFGQYRTQAEAGRAAESLSRIVNVKLTKSLSRREYFQRMIEE